MNNTIEKINMLGKIGYIVTKIAKVAVLIGAVVCLVGGIVMCFVPRDAVVIELVSKNSATVTVNSDIDIGEIIDTNDIDGTIEWIDNTYKITTDDGEGIVEKVTLRISDIKWILFVAVLACECAYIPLFFAGKLCKFFEKCDTPFDMKVSGILIKLAVSLIPVSIISSIADSIAESVLSGKLDISISVDLTSIIAILCILLLSFVFKHGTALQIESDETL